MPSQMHVHMPLYVCNIFCWPCQVGAYSFCFCDLGHQSYSSVMQDTTVLQLKRLQFESIESYNLVSGCKNLDRNCIEDASKTVSGHTDTNRFIWSFTCGFCCRFRQQGVGSVSFTDSNAEINIKRIQKEEEMLSFYSFTVRLGSSSMKL